MTTLTIKDLHIAEDLDRHTMSAVRGGLANQANSVNQMNAQELFAPVTAANASMIGSPANIQAESNPMQYAYNDSYSSNYQSSYTWESSNGTE